MTELLWWLLLLQALMTIVNTLVHHELLERLAFRTSARRELYLRGVGYVCYAMVALLLACSAPTGAWVWLIFGLVLVALGAVLLGRLGDKCIRPRQPSEQVLGGFLLLNLGVLAIPLVSLLWVWMSQPTAITPVSYGYWTPLFVLLAAGFVFFGLKNLAAARRLERWAGRSISADLGLVQSALELGSARSILVTGATGLIGSRLVPAWIAAGHSVTVLTRRPSVAAELGTPLTLVRSLDQLGSDVHIDAVVHLAGEPVAGGLWSEARKKYLLESRMAMPQEIGAWLARTTHKPEVWLSASAIGFYGVSDTPDEAFVESAPAGAGFAAHLCEQIEKASAKNAGDTRLVTLRIGLVLARESGYLAQLLPAVDLFVGVILGSGRQWQSWIHRDDAVRAIDRCLCDTEVRGPINVVAPEPVRAKALMKSLGRHLTRPVVMHLPGFALRVAAGDLADELLLASQRVAPEVLLQAGFEFRYPTLDNALDALLR